MEEEKLKSLLSKLKEVVNELECEIYSNVDNYYISNYEQTHSKITDYDEIWEDDDGYCD
jgi:uncharacterized protein VirK/YbjX